MQDASSRNANNFGSLRLLFAALVVLAHSPEIIDGNRTRELLTQMFGTMSFGGLAVDGFFIVSGYLITKSYVSSAGGMTYLSKRILRIYPGFLVASLICILAVAPMSGTSLSAASVSQCFWRLLMLVTPIVPGSFSDLPYPSLNGSMWTIAYEFKCYLLVLLLGSLGLVRNRQAYLAVTAGLTILYALRWHVPQTEGVWRALGDVHEMIRLAWVFFCGGLFYLFRDVVTYSKRGACIAGALLLPAMFSPMLAEPALVTLGGYLTFWFAFDLRPNAISFATNRTDPSYGLYLYAWPVQSLLVTYVVGISPWAVTAVTLLVAGLFGILSWHLIESPFLRRHGQLMQAWARLSKPLIRHSRSPEVREADDHNSESCPSGIRNAPAASGTRSLG